MDIAHYIEVYKMHEAKLTSTNERNNYWRRYNDELVKEQTKRENKLGCRDIDERRTIISFTGSTS